MKPATSCGAVAIGAILCGLAFAVAHSGEPQPAAEKRGSEHASIKAYPASVISLKDPTSGLLFYVETNGRRLVAFDKDGAVKWSTDVFDAGKFTPDNGAPVVRHLSVRDGTLWLTCGRHTFAKADLQTGKIEFAGAD